MTGIYQNENISVSRKVIFIQKFCTKRQKSLLKIKFFHRRSKGRDCKGWGELMKNSWQIFGGWLCIPRHPSPTLKIASLMTQRRPLEGRAVPAVTQKLSNMGLYTLLGGLQFIERFQVL